MRHLAHRALVVMLAVTFLWLAQGPGHAQSGLKVWPTEVELTVGRGEAVESAVNVENQGGEPVRLRTYAMDFSVDRESRYLFSEPGHETYSASRWLSLDDAEFELAGGERREITVGLRVPREAEPGGHYAALFIESVPSPSEVGVGISTRIPCLFYVAISDPDGVAVSADCSIASCILPGIVESGPVDAGVVLRNSGNVHLTAAAKAYFTDTWGKDSELDLGQVVILPNGERSLKGSWEDAPFLGRVNANLVVGYFDEQGQLVNKSRSAEFWVIPWKLLTGAAAGVIIIVAASWLVKKRFRLRIERR